MDNNHPLIQTLLIYYIILCYYIEFMPPFIKKENRTKALVKTDNNTTYKVLVKLNLNLLKGLSF